MFSPSKIKKDFPIFTDSNLVYLDNAATSQKPQAVLDAVDSLYKEANAN
ncbi:MAG: aminotransferase class V-fold PLP-dependent enzyme, partial [Candidatus Marinimicrobia bacterium]|nr:aminotransferase class V-fold PLP-dependent enzyme [Candidatus Neomarinimicrobiota bacterium]